MTPMRDVYVHETQLKKHGFVPHTNSGTIWAYCKKCNRYNHHRYLAPGWETQNWWIAVCNICNCYHDARNYLQTILRLKPKLVKDS